MRNPSTFEARLADAFENYALSAPLAIDSTALAAHVAGLPRARAGLVGTAPALRPLSLRLAVALLLAMTIVVAGAALISGRLNQVAPIPSTASVEPTPSSSGVPASRPATPVREGFAGSRFLVWLETGVNQGAITVLNGEGSVLGTARTTSRGCPSLVGGTGAIAYPGFGRLTIETIDGRLVDGVPAEGLDTNYTGFERWAPDRRSIALVDLGGGVISVVHLDPSTDWTGTTRHVLGLGGDSTVDAAFSGDGRRLVVAVAPSAAPARIDVHVLEGGDDRMVASVTSVERPFRLAVSPDGGRAAIVETTDQRPGRVVILGLDDGTTSAPITPSNEPVPLAPIGWSPDARTFAVRLGSGVSFVDAATATARNSGMYFHGDVTQSRWSDIDPFGIAMVEEPLGHMDVYLDGVGRPSWRLWSARGAMAPDGSAVVSVEVDGAAEAARVWLIPTWSRTDPQLLATLPLPTELTSLGSEGARDLSCLDWLAGGKS